MAEVEIYSSEYCPFCWRAKGLLTKKGVEFVEFEVDGKPDLRREMTERSGGYTVPQIFIAGKPIGGSDELDALEGSGELDRLLGTGD